MSNNDTDLVNSIKMLVNLAERQVERDNRTRPWAWLSDLPKIVPILVIFIGCLFWTVNARRDIDENKLKTTANGVAIATLTKVVDIMDRKNERDILIVQNEIDKLKKTP